MLAGGAAGCLACPLWLPLPTCRCPVSRSMRPPICPLLLLQHLLPGTRSCAQVAALPVGVYVATHWAVLFSWVHMWSLILLATGPLVFVCSLQGAPGCLLWEQVQGQRCCDGFPNMGKRAMDIQSASSCMTVEVCRLHATQQARQGR